MIAMLMYTVQELTTIFQVTATVTYFGFIESDWQNDGKHHGGNGQTSQGNLLCSVDLHDAGQCW